MARPPSPSTLRIHPPSLFSFLPELVGWNLQLLWGAISPFLSGQHMPSELYCYITQVVHPIFSRECGNISCTEVSTLFPRMGGEGGCFFPREEGTILQVWEISGCFGESLEASTQMSHSTCQRFPIFPAWCLALVSQACIGDYMSIKLYLQTQVTTCRHLFACPSCRASEATGLWSHHRKYTTLTLLRDANGGAPFCFFFESHSVICIFLVILPFILHFQSRWHKSLYNILLCL